MLGTLETFVSDLAHLGLWQQADLPDWSAVFPPGYDPDPGLVRAIRTVAPHYVPLWARRIYVSPTGDRRVFGYYAHGMWSQDPELPIEADAEVLGPVNPWLPTYGWHHRGGRVFCVDVVSDTWIKDSWQDRCNVPEPALTFDQLAVDWMRGTAYRLAHMTLRPGDDVVRIEKKKIAATKASLNAGYEQRKKANREDRWQILRWLTGKATSSTSQAPSGWGRGKRRKAS